MSFFAAAVIAFALAIDAFAVAVASGVSLKTVDKRQTFRLAFHFGLFQSLMTFLGWIGGVSVKPWIEAFDHWLAFGLLLFVGGKMIIEAFRFNEESQAFKTDPTKGGTMVLLSVATSIDALAVGLGFSMLHMSILMPVIVIGVVASAMTILGLHIGHAVSMKSRLGNCAQAIGGLVLLGIGLKVLIEDGGISLW